MTMSYDPRFERDGEVCDNPALTGNNLYGKRAMLRKRGVPSTTCCGILKVINNSDQEHSNDHANPFRD